MTLTLRKKLLIPVLIAALALLLWQIYHIFADTGYQYSSTATTTVVNKTAVPVNVLAAAAKTAELNKSAQSPLESSNATEKNNDNNKSVESVKAQPQQQANTINQAQQNYLQLVREYQNAQMKRLIAQDYEAIALSNRNAAQAMSQTKTFHVATTAESEFKQNNKPAKATGNDTYELVYTGEQAGHWNATVRFNDKLLDIEQGSVLANGEQVQTINQNEVVLSKQDTQTHISFYGVRTVKAEQPDVAANTASAQQATASKELSSPSTEANNEKLEQSMAKSLNDSATSAKKIETAVAVPAATEAVAPEKSMIAAAVVTPLVLEKPVTTPGVKSIVAEKHEVAAIIVKPAVAPTIAEKTETSELLKAEALVKTAEADIKSEFSSPTIIHTEKAPLSEVAIVTAEQLKTTKPLIEVVHAKKREQTIEQAPSKVIKHEKIIAHVKIHKQEVHAADKAKPVIKVAAKEIHVHKAHKSKQEVVQQAKNVKHHQAKPARDYSTAEKILLKRNNHFYTIELLRSEHLKTAQNYIQTNRISDKAYYYQQTQHGKHYYVVVYGQYPTAQATLAAIAELPIQLQRWAPELKANAAVKHEIERA